MTIQKLSDGTYRRKQKDANMSVGKGYGSLDTSYGTGLYADDDRLKLMGGGRTLASQSIARDFNVGAMASKFFNTIKKHEDLGGGRSNTINVKPADIANFIRKYQKAQG